MQWSPTLGYNPAPDFGPVARLCITVNELSPSNGCAGRSRTSWRGIIRSRQGPRNWPAVSPELDDAKSALRDQGIVIIPGLVPESVADRLFRYFKTSEVVGPNGCRVPLEELPPGTATAPYPLSTILECQDVLPLITADSILNIAAGYLGCKPTLSSLGVRWSFPTDTPPTSIQRFHRDPDDWRFLKLFVYLTDVDAESGPHSYVLRSHQTTGRVRARPYDQADIERRYGSASICPIVGPRGTAFMADTWGIHAGIVPVAAPRLILQAQYSLLPIYALDYRPLALDAPSGCDAYVTRLLLSSTQTSAKSTRRAPVL